MSAGELDAAAGGQIAIDNRDTDALSEDASGRAGRWLFGTAVLEESNARLTVAGQVHHLDRSSFELLRYLLHHSGSVVLKADLMHAGWPARVVSENSLAKSIARLRSALDDPAGEKICTVHGYGYRLCVPVELVARSTHSTPTPGLEPVADSPPRSSPHANVDPPRSSARLLHITLLSGLLLMLLVVAWRMGAEPAAPTATPVAPAQKATATVPSIAVLPFADMSQARDQQYFSDGLADELIDQLAKLPQLRVAGRTSSFSFRGKNDDVAGIGRKLNVTTILEGSVRKSGDRIRITVQLINVADGFHLWSETYDRKMTELFEVQDDIAKSVVAALKLQLLPGQGAAMIRHRTSDPEAYRQWLVGQSMHYTGTTDGARRAIAAYERAIAIDPKFASAYLALADLLGGDADYADSGAEVAEGKARSLELMDKGIALDPTLPAAYLARADFLYYTMWDWAGAQRDLDTFARLSPGEHCQGLVHQARLFSAFGRIREAIALDRRCIAVAPTYGAWGLLGYHHAVIGEYTQARQALERAYQLYPMDNHVTWYLGLTSLLEGKPEAAIAEFKRSGGGFRLAGLAMAQHDAGEEAASLESLKKLKERFGNSYAYQIAAVHAWRGETELAFDWLDRARRQRDASLMYMKFDPLLRKLHDDPRYAAWLKAMKLPP